MFNHLCTIFFLVVFCLGNLIHGYERHALLSTDPRNQLEEECAPRKYYVQASQLAFVNQEIFAQVENDWIPVNGVHSDTHGIYVLSNHPYHTRWRCGYCGYNNNSWDTTCQNELPNGKKCGNARPW